MRLQRSSWGSAVTLVAALVAIAGCGTSLAGSPHRGHFKGPSAYDDPSPLPSSIPSPRPSFTPRPLPQPQDFTTIQATVIQLLPDDTTGLPHQNFVVEEILPMPGATLSVNNDTHFGMAVPNLMIGEALTIKGVMYHDPRGDGIHWTHHINAPGDGGFIETPDGSMYQ